jgi:hypothetical protein
MRQDTGRFKDLAVQFYESGFFEYILETCEKEIIEVWRTSDTVAERELQHSKLQALEEISYLFGRLLDKHLKD